MTKVFIPHRDGRTDRRDSLQSRHTWQGQNDGSMKVRCHPCLFVVVVVYGHVPRDRENYEKKKYHREGLTHKPHKDRIFSMLKRQCAWPHITHCHTLPGKNKQASAGLSTAPQHWMTAWVRRQRTLLLHNCFQNIYSEIKAKKKIWLKEWQNKSKYTPQSSTKLSRVTSAAWQKSLIIQYHIVQHVRQSSWWKGKHQTWLISFKSQTWSQGIPSECMYAALFDLLIKIYCHSAHFQQPPTLMC